LLLAAVALATPVAAAPTTTTTTTAPAPASPFPAPTGPPPVAPPPAGFPVAPTPAPNAPVPPSLDWLTAAQTTGAAVTGKHVALELFGAEQVAVRKEQRAIASARTHIRVLDARAARTRRDIADLDARHTTLLAEERDRAVRAYIAGDDSTPITDILSAPSIDQSARMAVYADAAQTADIDSVVQAEAALSDAQGALIVLQHKLAHAHAVLTTQQRLLDRDYASLTLANAALNDASHGGRVFPVAGPFTFSDSWAAFRAHGAAGGQPNQHHATDIMAAKGTPVVAIETGTLDRVGWNTLGGWRLWIKGVSGVNYYYAHLSAYAPGLRAGVPVVAGQYLGRVGNTGDAQGGPTHLHFEVHLTPDAATVNDPPTPDGPAVNPYPLLCLLAGAPLPPIPPSTPYTPPATPATGTTTTTVPGAPTHSGPDD
jgi:murein DD-endopeptidase MepM/ murein hydrolase activator NlpD